MFSEVAPLHLGGRVAVELAAKNPNLVGMLALVESTPCVPPDAWSFHPAQAIVFQSTRAAVEFDCAPFWGHKPSKPR